MALLGMGTASIICERRRLRIEPLMLPDVLRDLADANRDDLIQRVKAKGFKAKQIGIIVAHLTGRKRPYTRQWINKRLAELKRTKQALNEED